MYSDPQMGQGNGVSGGRPMAPKPPMQPNPTIPGQPNTNMPTIPGGPGVGNGPTPPAIGGGPTPGGLPPMAPDPVQSQGLFQALMARLGGRPGMAMGAGGGFQGGPQPNPSGMAGLPGGGGVLAQMMGRSGGY